MRRKANAPSTIRPTVNKRGQPSAKTVELRKLFGAMPPRSHYPDQTFPFNPSKSEVIAWLMAHPQAGQILFNAVRDAAAIKFDQATRKWVGCNRRAQYAR